MIDINEDKIIDSELSASKDWIVNIPINQKELNGRFNLKNDEIHIDEIDFDNINVGECDLFRLDIPTSQNDLKKFFI